MRELEQGERECVYVCVTSTGGITIFELRNEIKDDTRVYIPSSSGTAHPRPDDVIPANTQRSSTNAINGPLLSH